MKKLFSILFILILIVPSALADSAPNAIEKAFSASQWKGWAIAQWAAGDELAVVILRKDDSNRLCVLTPSGSGWKVLVHSTRAIYQGDRLPDRILLDGSGAFELHYGQNLLRFAKNQNIWRISRVEINDEDLVYTTIVIYSDKLVYKRTAGDENDVTVTGVTNRNLQYFIFKNLPRSPEAARKVLSSPPALPHGALSAQVVDFEGGHKFPVYAGPGADYLRPVEGKCVVSTNDWIQVFGQENGWLLIQYDRNSSQMRFGYIKADSLEKSPVSLNEINALPFESLPVKTTQATDLTDDPLFGREALAQVPKGAPLTYLTSLADWAYVEYAPVAGAKMRGFIPMSTLQVPQPTAAPTQAPMPASSQKYYPIQVDFGSYSVKGEAIITGGDHLSVYLSAQGAGMLELESYTLFMNHTAVLTAPVQSPQQEYFQKPEFEYGSAVEVEITYTLSPMPALIGLCPVKNGQLVVNEMISLSP